MAAGETTAIAIFGHGQDAANIAALAAHRGLIVHVVGDADDGAGESTVLVEAALAELAEDGESSPTDGGSPLDRVIAPAEPAALGSVGVVIEAVPDDPEAKAAAITRIDQLAPDAIIATTTGLGAVTGLAARSRAPERVGGLHFMRPAHRSSIVEVVRAELTGEGAFGALVAVAEALGLEPVAVKDRPGFLVQRLLVPYLNDAIQCLDDGLASARDLDVAIELGLGYPKGPLRVLDEIGLDAHERSARALFESLHDPHYAPPPLLERKVQAGQLGTKSGRGFRVGDQEEPS